MTKLFYMTNYDKVNIKNNILHNQQNIFIYIYKNKDYNQNKLQQIYTKFYTNFFLLGEN